MPPAPLGSRNHPPLPPCRNFDSEPHLQLLKEMLTQVFATPKRHHKSKPFFDHVISFTVADGRLWLRNYQVGTAGVPSSETHLCITCSNRLAPGCTCCEGGDRLHALLWNLPAHNLSPCPPALAHRCCRIPRSRRRGRRA